MIYVCSPYKGDVDKNRAYAKQCCRQVMKEAKQIPIAPHLYFTQFLDDDNPIERKMGLDCGIRLLDMCKELWVFGDKVSSGMHAEILHAKKKGIPIKYIHI